MPFSVHNTFISRLLYMNQITISGPWVRTYLSIRVPDELFISLCIIHDVQLVSKNHRITFVPGVDKAFLN